MDSRRNLKRNAEVMYTYQKKNETFNIHIGIHNRVRVIPTTYFLRRALR